MPQYYDLEFSLCSVTPRIWRRILTRREHTFAHLWVVFIMALKWSVGKEWVFWREPYHSDAVASSNGRSYELLVYEGLGVMVRDVEGPKNPENPYIELEDYFGTEPGVKGIWTFDPGKETWDFEVLSHGLIELPDDFRWRLLDGARAFPPYDLEDRSAMLNRIGMRVIGAEGERAIRRIEGWEIDQFDLEVEQAVFDR